MRPIAHVDFLSLLCVTSAPFQPLHLILHKKHTIILCCTKNIPLPIKLDITLPQSQVSHVQPNQPNHSRGEGETYRLIRMVKIIRHRHQRHSIISILGHILPGHKIKETSCIHNNPMILELLPIHTRKHSFHDLPVPGESGLLLRQEVLVRVVVLLFPLWKASGDGGP